MIKESEVLFVLIMLFKIGPSNCQEVMIYLAKSRLISYVSLTSNFQLTESEVTLYIGYTAIIGIVIGSEKHSVKSDE